MDDEIYEKLNKIEALDDKLLLKNILNGVFSELKNYTNNKIGSLEDRVFNEVRCELEKYNIFTSIIKRDQIDTSNNFFFPMIKDDLKEEEYKFKDIMECISEKEPMKLFKIFLKCNYLEFRNFLDKNFQFKGNIETDKRVHEAYFAVEKNKDYEKCIERLYECFINNNIAWSSVNNPYIHKMVDVYLIDVKDTIEPDENIVSINVDFGEYEKYVMYNMVPIWNVQELTLKGNGFPVPCKDKLNYEHTISLIKEGTENGFLIKTKDESISYIMFREDSIIVTAREYNPKKWQVLKVAYPNEDMGRNYDFKIMSNVININFSNNLLFKNRRQVKTKSELSRLIHSYKASAYLRFSDIKIEDYDEENIPETYEVNDFITDEIRMENLKKRMVLYFQPLNKEDYLNFDNLSFLVSEVQLIFPEYKCEGRLI